MGIRNGDVPQQEGKLSISPEEMVDELLGQIANLQMQLAASNILIRKLQGEANGQAFSQEAQLPEEQPVRSAK